MIVPESRAEETRGLVLAGSVTSSLLVLVFLLLQVARLPSPRSHQDVLRELELDFLPSPLLSSARPALERSSLSAPQIADPVEDGAVEDALAGLMRRLRPDASPGLAGSTGPGSVGQTGPGLNVDDSPLSALSGITSGDAAVALPPPADVPRRRGLPPTSALHVQDGSVSGSRGSGEMFDAVEPSVADRSESTGEAYLPDIVPGDFSASDLDAVGQLATWIRAHPVDLPPGLKVHLGYLPSFLSSAASFTSDGRRWEVFLMYKETLKELHVVLVDGDTSVYLTDRGFRSESRSLREGVVRRENGVIMSVDSMPGDASGSRAREFYGVFLSWWEDARKDLEG